MRSFDRGQGSGMALWRRFRSAVVLFFTVALAASVAAVVTPMSAGADPGESETRPSAGSWIDAGWASHDAVLDGPAGATGVIELDWEADETAVTGDRFELRLPFSLSPVDPDTEVELPDAEDYLGATGTWSHIATGQSLLTVELEQDGTVENAAGELELLGGTVALEVTWSASALESLSDGEQKLMLKGPGFDGADQVELTAVYIGDEDRDETPSPTPSTPTPTTPGDVSSGDVTKDDDETNETETTDSKKVVDVADEVVNDPEAEAERDARSARIMALADNPVTDVCTVDTYWTSWGTTITANELREYHFDGTPTDSMPLTIPDQERGTDIAMDGQGRVMWVVSGNGQLDAYDMEVKGLIQSFQLEFYRPDGVTTYDPSPNSMSFSGDTLLIGGSRSSAIHHVPDLPTPVPGGPLETVAAPVFLDAPGSNGAGSGYAGDFVTLADGSILAFVNTGRNILGLSTGTSFMLIEWNGQSFNTPRRIGQVRSNTGAILWGWGATYLNGSLFVATQLGPVFRMDGLPSFSGAATQQYRLEIAVPDSGGAYLGATSVQESNAICSSPNLEVTKEGVQLTGPDAAGDYTAQYTVTVINAGGAAGTYSTLTDTPAFDPNLEVKGASWTGAASGSLTGPGPYALQQGNITLASGAVDTYQVSVRFAYAEGIYDNASACAAVPTAGTGLTNIIGLSGSSELDDEAVACLEPPAAPPAPVAGAVAWNKVAQGSAELLSGSEWLLVAADDGVEVEVTDCIADTSSECEGPDTNPEAGRFVVAGLDQGDYELVETKAPAGYVLDDTPRILTVGEGDPVALDIENVQRDALVIPLTGGMGADRFLLIGGLLAALAAAGVVWRHRRQPGLDGSITA